MGLRKEVKGETNCYAEFVDVTVILRVNIDWDDQMLHHNTTNNTHVIFYIAVILPHNWNKPKNAVA